MTRAAGVVYRVALASWSHRRRAVWLLVAAAAVMLVAAPLAYADPPKPGGVSPIMAPFNYADSHDIHVDQYQLAYDADGLFVGPVIALLLTFGWEIYRWSIGALAWAVDWALSMPWLGMISGPLHDIADQINDTIIEPLGIWAFLLLILACAVGLQLRKGGLAGGFTRLVSGLIVAAIAALLLASPVAWVTGEPMKLAQRSAVQLANMAVTAKWTDTELEAKIPASEVKAGDILVETLVRPMHANLNFGVDIDKERCKDTYDQALREGPYKDPKDLLKKLNKCDKAYGEYASAPSASGIFLLLFQQFTLLCTALNVLVFAGLLMLVSVYAIWKAFTLAFAALIAIPGGASLSGLTVGAARILAALCSIPVLSFALAINMRITKGVLSSAQPLAGRMLLFGLLQVLGSVLLIGLAIWWFKKSAKVGEWGSKKLANAAGASASYRAPTSLAARTAQARHTAQTTSRVAQRTAQTTAGIARRSASGVAVAGRGGVQAARVAKGAGSVAARVTGKVAGVAGAATGVGLAATAVQGAAAVRTAAKLRHSRAAAAAANGVSRARTDLTERGKKAAAATAMTASLAMAPKEVSEPVAPLPISAAVKPGASTGGGSKRVTSITPTSDGGRARNRTRAGGGNHRRVISVTDSSAIPTAPITAERATGWARKRTSPLAAPTADTGPVVSPAERRKAGARASVARHQTNEEKLAQRRDQAVAKARATAVADRAAVKRTTRRRPRGVRR